MSEPLVCRVEDRVAYLTLNRPPHNALDLQLCEGLKARCATLSRQRDLAAVVISGAGEGAFCAGGDIKWMAGKTAHEWQPIAHEVLHGAMNAVAAMPVPVIAAVHGHALGGGLELALACDWIIASEDAVFGFPEVFLGIFPGAGGSQRLPRQMPPGPARRLILTGRRIGAGEAAALGLVAEVAPAGALWQVVETDLEALRQAPTGAVRHAKRAMTDGLEMPLPQALRAEADLIALRFGTPEQQRGFARFLDRPRPAGRDRWT